MTSPIRKPNVFIGSSREAIPYATAVCSHLERVAQVNPWFAAAFGANDYTMEALERELDANDFGVFIFAAEDVALIRDKTVFVTRDNTLFEMGIFWGKFRRRRVFCMIPRDIPEHVIQGKTVSEFHLPSDLDGLTLLRYVRRDDDKYAAAVVTACSEIMRVIEREKPFIDPLQLLAEQQAELERKQSILHFFWEYIRNVTVTDPATRYSAFSEAIRNSLLAPEGFRTTGAAIWKKIDEEHIGQVGGNVGRNRIFHLKENEGKTAQDQKIYVLDAFNSGKWSFFNRREIAEVYVLCYPLGKEHVLSVHISGIRPLSDEECRKTVEVNDELLITIRHLVGGDSK